MKYQQLQYLEAAIRLNSMRRAAAEFDVAQPTLAHQIQRLEEELDVVLLIRSPSGVVPSETAVRLLPKIKATLHATAAIYQEAGTVNAGGGGMIRLGAVPAAHVFVPRALNRVLQQYPSLQFHVTANVSRSIVPDVIEGVLDLGIVWRWETITPEPGRLQAEDLRSTQLGLCVPRGHPLESSERLCLNDLKGERFVVPGRGNIMREAFDALSPHVDANVMYETSDSRSAVEAVEAGFGVTFFGVEGNQPTSRGKSTTIPLDTDWPRIVMSLIRRSQERPTPAANTLARYIRDEADAEFVPVA